MGDSAGGGMTVAVALQLRDRGLAAPYRTVLISPWLDISVAAPDISALAAKDHELAPPGLVAAGELYRGEVPAEDPRVSPINGGPFGLGPITLFSGTHDILHSDAKRCRWAERRACRLTTTKCPARSTSTPCSRSRRPSDPGDCGDCENEKHPREPQELSPRALVGSVPTWCDSLRGGRPRGSSRRVVSAGVNPAMLRGRCRRRTSRQ
jgi:hypothetical protein